MKVTEQLKEKMIHYVESDALISLKEIKEKLHVEEGVSVSIPTIHKYLECQLYTIKKVLPQPIAMNSEENKRKRAAYVTSIMAKIGIGKTAVYIDETNCNLFLRRNFGRSKNAQSSYPRQTLKNIYVIGGIIHVIGGIIMVCLAVYIKSFIIYLQRCSYVVYIRTWHDEHLVIYNYGEVNRKPIHLL